MKHPFEEILPLDQPAAESALVPAVSNRRNLLKSALLGGGALALLAGCESSPDATTQAVGEEGGTATLNYGEAGNATSPATRRYGENGGIVTTRMGEEGNITTRGPGGGSTTMMMGESGGNATLAMGESGGSPGSNPFSTQPAPMTSMALGEEG